MKAMILAAGLGTRMRPHSLVLPKPAFPFLNTPLVYYPLHLLERLGLSELVVNTHHLPEKLLPVLRSIPEMNFKLHISPEEGQILGSGGGIGHAREYLKGDGFFCTINGDEVIFPSSRHVLPSFLKQHHDSGAIATLLVMRHPGVGTQFGGVWVDKQGYVRGFGKSKPQGLVDVEAFHFTGLQAFSDRIFDYIPGEGESNIFYDVVMKAIAQGEKAKVFVDTCVWFETGNPQDYLKATQECLSLMQSAHESPWLKEIFMRFWPDFESRPSLWEGQNCHHHLGDLAERPVLLGDRVKLHGSVEVEGFAVIGSETLIGQGCKLKNCVVGSKLVIPPGTVIENDLCLELK